VRFATTVSNQDFLKTIHLDIDEGPQIRIKKIDVVGKLTKPEKYYSKFIRENSSEAIEDGYYVKADIDTGLKNLITDLKNQGLLKAKILSSRVEFRSDGREAYITVVLEEGPLTTIKDIIFIGVKSVPESELIDKLGLKPSEPLRLEQLEQGLEQIKSHYSSLGFIEMIIENESDQVVTYDSKFLNATVKIHIREGPQVFVREILVEGNSFTKSYVITREINIEPGDLLTPEALEEARRRLDKLNLFSRVEIKTLEANTNVSKRTLIVTVTERNPGVFRIGLGVTNKRELTARGFTGITYDNIGGAGRAISLRLSAENNLIFTNYLEYDINAGYLEPFLFDTKFRGRVNVGREVRVNEYFLSEKVSRIRASNRLGFFAERDITSRLRFVWNAYTLESIEFFDDPRPVDGFTGSKEQIATVGPLFDIDYRDNTFLPSRGFFFRIEADVSSPLIFSSDGIEFHRTQSTFSFYNNFFNKKLIWANSIRGGYAKNISNDIGSGIPENYAFFLGDFLTIRGFSGVDGDRIPDDRILRPSRAAPISIPNETSYYLIKSELRFPLYGILGGAVFYDGGEVMVQGFDFPKPYRSSAGIGLRINLPFLPISIDYARKLEFADDPSKGQLHIFIGVF
jgi:outer membrane protein assembly complex protein YaeT